MGNINKKLIYIPDFLIMLHYLDTSSEEKFCIMDLKRKTGSSYAWVHNMKKEFVKRGWVREELSDTSVKRKYLFLTESGRSVLVALYNLLKSLNINIEDLKNYNVKSKHKKKIKEVNENETNTTY